MADKQRVGRDFRRVGSGHRTAPTVSVIGLGRRMRLRRDRHEQARTQIAPDVQCRRPRSAASECMLDRRTLVWAQPIAGAGGGAIVGRKGCALPPVTPSNVGTCAGSRVMRIAGVAILALGMVAVLPLPGEAGRPDPRNPAVTIPWPSPN
jgi:hypothetical protein